MTHWNHRVIRTKDTDGSDLFAIHEVHYDDDGIPAAYTENPVGLLSESIVGLKKQLGWIQNCLDKSALAPEDFKGKISDV